VSLLIAILLAIFVLPSPWGVVAILVSAVWEVGEAYLMIRWTQRWRAQVGSEALVGKTARVVVACTPKGQVSVKGERWQARCEIGAGVGEDVVVRAIDGLTLVVVPAEAADLAATD
jgi:membrane protein implicated in regulation of membrane protease activity